MAATAETLSAGEAARSPVDEPAGDRSSAVTPPDDNTVTGEELTGEELMGVAFSSTTSTSSFSVEEAETRLGPAILRKLDAKFKGKVVGVRQPDAQDLLF